MTLNDLLTQIEDRASAATEGPWQHGYNDKSGLVDEEYEFCITYDNGTEPVFHGELLGHNLDDAEFIAHSREDIPKLCKALRRAIEVIDWYGDDSAIKQIKKILEKP